MEKNRWLDFLSHNLQSQIHLEWTRKLQTWVLFVIGFASFGVASTAIASIEGKAFLFTTKLLYLIFFHGLMIFGFYFPTISQKGEGAVARFLGVRDFTSLSTLYLFEAVGFLVVSMLSWQIINTLETVGMSSFFIFTAWLNFSISLFYLGSSLFFAASYFFFPSTLVKFTEKSSKLYYTLVGFHSVAAFLMILGYMEVVKIGSVAFFEQFKITGLFWTFMVFTLFGIGKLLRGSSVPALTSLQLEVASGKLQRSEDILKRFQDAFILRRLAFWIKRISHRAATCSHEIAQYTHDAVAMAEKEKPTELDLQQVEERYKKADVLYKKLDKENARFLLAMTLFDLSESEQEKVEALRDVFSKELRNAKLELASVRKRIDEKLVAIKNIERPQLTTAPEPEQIAAVAAEEK